MDPLVELKMALHDLKQHHGFLENETARFAFLTAELKRSFSSMEHHRTEIKRLLAVCQAKDKQIQGEQHDDEPH